MENTVFKERRKQEKHLRDEVLEAGRLGRSMMEKAQHYEDLKEEKEAMHYDLEVLKNQLERMETQLQQERLNAGNRIRDST